MDKKIYAIVLAAGSGTRMKSATQQKAKQFMDLNGFPVLFYSLKAFEQSNVDGIILVTAPQFMTYAKTEIVDRFSISKCIDVVAGGAERFDSVYNGLAACEKLNAGYVLIHDGARPMVTKEMINNIIEETKEHNAVIAACHAKDTIKLADANDYVASTPDRRDVWQVQTPQSFSFDIVHGAYKAAYEAGNNGYTDDASVVERMTAQKIKLFDCGYTNIKITTNEDLTAAKIMLDANCYN